MAPPELIYLDNNATTRPDPRVVEAMLPFYRESWGNASSRHRHGDAVAAAIRKARRIVGEDLGYSPRGVIFTSSGTEADNLALRGVLGASPQSRHLVVSAVEHPAVLDTARALRDSGDCELDILGVDEQGRIDLGELKALLRPGETRLVSIMAANNETGVVYPGAMIAALAHDAGALYHCDAVQAVGKLPLHHDEIPADLISISAHKFHGPKGVGALLVRDGVELCPMLTGGGQERGRRSGTENPAGIVGLAHALRLAIEGLPEAAPRMARLRDQLEDGLLERVSGLEVTAPQAPRTPNTLHLSIGGIESDALLTLLDEAGIAISAGSACSTGSLEPSHVLTAHGVSPDRLHCALRISLSRYTIEEEIQRMLELLPTMVERLRSLQPGAGS